MIATLNSMQSIIDTTLLSDVALNQKELLIVSVNSGKIDGLFTLLTEKGMDRLTESKIEHVICTTALAAFF